MHPSLSTRGAQRRRTIGNAMKTPDSTCVMQLTVDAGAITMLRQLVMHVCGETLEFMRIALCADTGRMKVWLCVRSPMVGLVMAAVIRSMPEAEFGRFTGTVPQVLA
jgi:hypothetical protein